MIEIGLPESAWEGVDAGVQALLDRWLVAPGDAVQEGQPVATVVLVKASIEVVAPAAGLMRELHVAAGETFARGHPIASLQEAGA